MSDPIKNDLILKEVLDVLKKYSIPVNTITLEMSLLNDDFDEVFPLLKDYRSGIYYRSQSIDDVPSTIKAQRRVPFGKIVQWLEENVLPFAEKVVREIEQEFENVGARINHHYHDERVNFSNTYGYNISINCRLRTETKIEEGNTVTLAIGVSQYDATSFPTFYDYVGWLVDEESGGDWGIDMVANVFQEARIYPGFFDTQVKRALPLLQKYLEDEVKKLSPE